MSNSPMIEVIYSEFRDDEDFAELIQMFTDSIPEKVDMMKSALASNNISKLQTFSHQLKGCSAGYGFSQLTDLSASLETACKNGDLLEITKELEIVLNYMSRISV